MIGDTPDMLARIKMVLPTRWFGDITPILNAVLTGLASAWSGLFGQLSYVKAQTRIGTASDIFLDIVSADYMGSTLPRHAGESDAAFRLRIQQNLLAPRATRAAVAKAVFNLTGREPVIFEPLNATDTGGYNTYTLAYGARGGYGTFSLPLQFFVKAFRPDATPISNAGGYNFGPGGYGQAPMFYADQASDSGFVTDADIYAAIALVLPTCGVAWTNISN